MLANPWISGKHHLVLWSIIDGSRSCGKTISLQDANIPLHNNPIDPSAQIVGTRPVSTAPQVENSQPLTLDG
jgi:hypothetical protein